MSGKDESAALGLRPASKSAAAAMAELFKIRLTSLVLVTTAVGYYMGTRGRFDWAGFAAVLGGTGLLACGAAALNQWMERGPDGCMVRTRGRPLPSGRILPGQAVALGLTCAGLGLGILWGWSATVTAWLGLATLLTYLLVYTPLKRITPVNTVVGAVPGAMPPLMGWSAAREGVMESEGWALFAILVFWQLPHFLAIAWMYREDYARGGFAMLSVFDPDGSRTAAHALAHTLGLVAVSLSPVALGMAGYVYLAGALGLGAVFFLFSYRFGAARTDAVARRLFLCSIVYLPLLLGLMVVDKR